MQITRYIALIAGVVLMTVGVIGFLFGAALAMRDYRPVWDIAESVPILLQSTLVVGVGAILLRLAERGKTP